MSREKEHGQSLIIIAGVVLVLLALVALVVDVGNAYAHRRMVQNATDAAALAGARRLAERNVGQTVLEIQVLNDVLRYAEINGLERDVVLAWFIDADGDRLETVDPYLGPAPPDAEGVEVSGDLPFVTYFAHLLGFPEMTASTVAKAWVLSGACSAFNLFPITMSTSIFTNTTGAPEFGHIYTIWDKDEKNSPGNWGWLYWEDGDGNCRCPYEGCCPQEPSSSNLGENIFDNTNSGYWSVGDWVHGTSGTQMQSVLKIMKPYIPPHPEEPWPEVVIPLFDRVINQGNNTLYRISGFAGFKLRCAFNGKGAGQHIERKPGDCDPCNTGSSNRKCVRGEFVRMVLPSGQDGCTDTGLYIPSFRKPQQ